MRCFVARRLPHNKQLQRTGRFLRFGGHPELTVQECRDAKTRTEDDEQIQ